MNFADERQAIETAFQAGWNGAAPVKYENVEFTVDDKKEPYVVLEITGGKASQISLNPNATYRHPGIIIVKILAPKDSGTNRARELADIAANIFRSKQFSAGNGGRITCFTPSLSVIGVDQGWYQLNLTVPYWRDTVFN